ncbi:ribosome-associated protein [Streptoalloteichus tenebrarius]|uniref:Ribosome-associated protein n=1 Tax=Streptoalloteichus tenebrarius (strain ATCC 17920 / DSM 40477 / JCM 4838 / CBS 697.72 / NBRC 16177 / NCIMB 11028 / NRRL B-12390 / A12253. 1 / ISP 5477) TaxID=1933 RepID=A0ABT1HW93_STRSD|nr:alternative ribosome rescue aminoacyl-tRNA hydrolase ArfB [Streptoalloteichus tenebrarius]MCP2259785.1 ribosome-associated protein [Streptoalloteichus tenebrarius]BFE99269.1 alternative ribosome rescue aminoacyl-tRNA hydrolase ArfB [Streptoalloteichus tenebrarius]
MLGDVDGDLRVSSAVVIPRAELKERFSRSSGPGGQSVNTTDSRVELSFDIGRSAALTEHAREQLLRRLRHRLVDGVLTVAAMEHRSQLMNRQAARERLTDLLRAALAPPPPPRRPSRPSRAAKERRLAAKRQRATIKRARRGRHDDD